MKFIFLTDSFYSDYATCTQIEQKQTRPYTQAHIEVNGTQFAVPLRSGITHTGRVLWTDRQRKCGLDFTKAVVITDDKYIDKEKQPYIRQNEFDSLRGKEHLVKQLLQKHITDYNKAKTDMKTVRDKNTVAFSTMQYFEEYIGDISNSR